MNNTEPIEVRMANEWYSLATEDHFWIEWRFQLLLKSLGDLISQPIKILDIGCGNGSTARTLETFGAVTVDGCELNPQMIELVKMGKGQFYFYDLLSQTLKQTQYDAALMLDVVEHVADDLGFLKAANEHLRPGGKLFITVPALQSLFSNYDLAAGHVRRYTKQSLSSVISSAGFRVIEQYYWGFSLLPLAVLRKLYLNFVSEDLIIQKGFEPPNKAASNLLKFLGKLERRAMEKPPLGTSLFLVAEKLS